MKAEQPKSIVRCLRPVFVFLFTCFLWIIRIPLVQAYYERTLHLGYYRPDADSISIPIAGEAVATFVLFPILAILLLLLLWHFPPRCSWLAWNKK
jgi:hypothetical protein